MAKKNKFKRIVYGKKEQQTAERKKDKTESKLSEDSISDPPEKEISQHLDKHETPQNKMPLSQKADKGSPLFQMKKKPGKGDDRKSKVNDDSVRKKRITDPKLIPRMKEYLESRANKGIVSIPLMAEYLQKKHMEYTRRKRGVFTKYIEKAYAIMDGQSQSHPASSADEVSDSDIEGNEQNESGEPRIKRRKMLKYDDDADCFVEEEVLMEYKDTNAINSMMSNLYKSSPQPSPGPRIDIPPADSDLDIQIQNNGSSKPNDPEQKQNGVFFIDTKGDNKKSRQSDSLGGARNSRDENINRFMGGLPARSSAVNNGAKDPRLFRIDTGNQRMVEKATHGGITLDNTGVSLDPPSSPTSEVQKDVEEIVIDSDTEDLPLKKNSKDGASMGKDTPRREKKSKNSNKTKKGKEGTSTADKKEDGPGLQMSSVTFADIGGNEQSLVEICKLLVHMRHPEVYKQLGVTPPRGFLLHGPPGCGKTLLANAIAGELELPMLKIAATEIVSGVSGDSEEKVRELFDMATRSAPCVLFIDEVDAITPKRETASKDMERRIVSQLLTCMDDLNKNTEAHVLVIGATNRPDSLDPALRRAGRFDKEVCLGIPDETSRKRILEVLCRNLRLTPEFDFTFLAKSSPGFVGADLMSLTREAAMVAVNRVFKDLQSSTGEKSSQVNTADSVATKNCDKQIQMDTSEPSNTPVTSSSALHSVTDSATQSDSVKNSVNQSQTHSSDISTVNQLDSVVKQTDKEMTSQNDVQSNSDSLTAECDVNDLINKEKNANNTEVSSEKESPKQRNSNEIGKTTDLHASELCSVLSWLKDQPPLTENQLRDLFVTLEDFKEALKSVQPSAKREGFATVPDVTWDDIGALHNVREELQLAILAPVRHSEEFRSLGLNRAQGVLLAGPPGCGKTLLAKAVANESGINFISVKGPELLNMYVGESEKAVRTVFQRARNSSPCVIFFDELDALCPRRSGSADNGSSSRVVNQLLTEMDGLEERKQVFIMAATNRPDIIDPAVLRPGRLDKTLYVGLPTLSDRLDILLCLTKNGTRPLLSSDVDMSTIAADQRCENYTGADLAALVREASVSALKEAIGKLNRTIGDPIAVNNAHFETAFRKIKLSVSDRDRERYSTMGNKLSLE